MPTEKQSIQTLTGEIFQPIRLYYRLHNKSAVQVAFNKLRCMDFDTPGQRRVWVYDDEAKKLQFDKPWSSIPPERRPIVLGSFYTRVDEEMYLDVGSIERALAAITFFDRHIKRASAELTYVAVYNRLPASQAEHPGSCFDALFASVDTGVIERKIDERMGKVADLVESGRIEDITNDRSFELVEAFPANFYNEGLEHLRTTLMMRQTVALKRWNGHVDYSDCVKNHEKANLINGLRESVVRERTLQFQCIRQKLTQQDYCLADLIGDVVLKSRSPVRH